MLLFENSFNTIPSVNILNISQYDTGIIAIVLAQQYYFLYNEEIQISGTDALDGIYKILDIDWNDSDVFYSYGFKKARIVYIATSITNLTISLGPATVSPNYTKANTARVIMKNKINMTIGDKIYIVDVGEAWPTLNNPFYIISKILGPFSCLIDCVHSPESIIRTGPTEYPSMFLSSGLVEPSDFLLQQKSKEYWPLTFSSITIQNKGTTFLLLENSFFSNPIIDISSITITESGLIKIVLSAFCTFSHNEEIIITGTNSLDGTYNILLLYTENSTAEIDEFAPKNVIYIKNTLNETDLSFTLASVIPNYTQANTARILSRENIIVSVGDSIIITDNQSSPLTDNTTYLVSAVLGPRSFLIEFNHTQDSISNDYTITGQIGSALSDIHRNQDVILYRVESKEKTNEIGGINLELINNTKYSIHRILDANSFIIDLKGSKATEAGNFGGSNVYISSLVNGNRTSQLNTYDGTINSRLFRSVSLEGYNYIYLCSYGKETELDVIDSNNTNVSNIFAKILLDQPIGHMCFDSFISTEKIFYTPIPELSELTFIMFTPDGELYNFNDTDYSLDLEITNIIEEIEESNIGSKNNSKLKYSINMEERQQQQNDNLKPRSKKRN